MFQAIKKRRAIQSYRNRLGPYLNKKYGQSKHYTPTQVRAGAQDLGLDTLMLCYAMAMYSSPEDFAIYHQTTGQACDYNTMRDEVSDTGSGWFGGLFDSSSFDSCSYDSGVSDGGFDGGGDGGD